MVLPGSRAATLPTVSLYSISNSKSNLMLPAAAAEGVDMDCEGLMKARMVLVALTREHRTPLRTHVICSPGNFASPSSSLGFKPDCAEGQRSAASHFVGIRNIN